MVYLCHLADLSPRLLRKLSSFLACEKRTPKLNYLSLMKAGPILSFLIKHHNFNRRSDQKDEACLWSANEKQFPDDSFFFFLHPENALIKTWLVTSYHPLMNIQVEWNDVLLSCNFRLPSGGGGSYSSYGACFNTLISIDINHQAIAEAMKHLGHSFQMKTGDFSTSFHKCLPMKLQWDEMWQISSDWKRFSVKKLTLRKDL